MRDVELHNLSFKPCRVQPAISEPEQETRCVQGSETRGIAWLQLDVSWRIPFMASDTNPNGQVGSLRAVNKKQISQFRVAGWLRAQIWVTLASSLCGTRSEHLCLLAIKATPAY
jgi:hypothetical protein